MSKFCPTAGHKVPYLTCQECEERVCENQNAPRIILLPKKDKPTEAPVKAEKPVAEKVEKITKIYYLVQSYWKTVDTQYQRHLYPAYLADFKMTGESLMIQSGLADALKFQREIDAKEWQKKAEQMFEDRTFDVVPFDARIFGKQLPRYVIKPQSMADCDNCCHCGRSYAEHFANKTIDAVSCKVHGNLIIDKNAVKEKGCSYYNLDMSQEKICMNCSKFLGGGDWGLACSAHYHRLPTPLTPACEDFDNQT